MFDNFGCEDFLRVEEISSGSLDREEEEGAISGFF